MHNPSVLLVCKLYIEISVTIVHYSNYNNVYMYHLVFSKDMWHNKVPLLYFPLVKNEHLVVVASE